MKSTKFSGNLTHNLRNTPQREKVMHDHAHGVPGIVPVCASLLVVSSHQPGPNKACITMACWGWGLLSPLLPRLLAPRPLAAPLWVHHLNQKKTVVVLEAHGLMQLLHGLMKHLQKEDEAQI